MLGPITLSVLKQKAWSSHVLHWLSSINSSMNAARYECIHKNEAMLPLSDQLALVRAYWRCCCWWHTKRKAIRNKVRVRGAYWCLQQHASTFPLCINSPRVCYRLIDQLKHMAQAVGCYKIILDCLQHNVTFYERCGLKVSQVQMTHYFQTQE